MFIFDFLWFLTQYHVLDTEYLSRTEKRVGWNVSGLGNMIKYILSIIADSILQSHNTLKKGLHFLVFVLHFPGTRCQ